MSALGALGVRESDKHPATNQERTSYNYPSATPQKLAFRVTFNKRRELVLNIVKLCLAAGSETGAKEPSDIHITNLREMKFKRQAPSSGDPESFIK